MNNLDNYNYNDLDNLDNLDNYDNLDILLVKERLQPCIDFINANIDNFVLIHRIIHKNFNCILYDVSLTMDLKMVKGSMHTCLHFTNLSVDELNKVIRTDENIYECYKSVECDCIRDYDGINDLIKLSENNSMRMNLLVYDISGIMDDFISMIK